VIAVSITGWPPIPVIALAGGTAQRRARAATGRRRRGMDKGRIDRLRLAL